VAEKCCRECTNDGIREGPTSASSPQNKSNQLIE